MPFEPQDHIGWGIVSYIIRYYFNPCGTGSHLYPANTNTLRSRTLSSRSYATLVGLGVSPLPCFPLCTCIIAHSWLFVKYFFYFFLLAVRLERTSSLCRLNRRHQPQMGEPDSNGWNGTPGDSPQPTHTICVFFAKSYIFPRRYLARTSSKENGRESPSPSRLEVIAPTFRTFFHSHLFCTLIVSQLGRFVKRNFCFRWTFFTRCTISPILVSLAGTSS